MALLTDLIEVENLSKKVPEKQRLKYADDLLEFRRSVNNIFVKNGISLRNEDLKRELLSKESTLYTELWNKCNGSLPDIEELEKSCTGDPTTYTSMVELQKYPRTTVGTLKKLADKLGFVIVFAGYVDMNQIIDMYKKEDSGYGYELEESIQKYKRTMRNTYFLRNQTYYYYLLCPSSFYDPWLEIISDDERVSMYFGEGLEMLKTTLGMTIPTQRNLYKMIKSTKESVDEIKRNIKDMQDAMQDFHKRLTWVEDMVRDLKKENEQIRSQNQQLHFELQKANAFIREQQIRLASMLDPIYFAIPKCDMYDPRYDDTEAVIGACFGVDMPVEFFAEKGLTIYSDKSMNFINKPLKGIVKV